MENISVTVYDIICSEKLDEKQNRKVVKTVINIL
jgi:hypothetical protein